VVPNRSRGNDDQDEKCFVKGALGEVAAVLCIPPWVPVIHRLNDRVATYGLGDIEVEGKRYEVKAQYCNLLERRRVGYLNINCRAHRKNPGQYVAAVIDQDHRIAAVTCAIPAEDIGAWEVKDYGYGDPCHRITIHELLGEYR